MKFIIPFSKMFSRLDFLKRKFDFDPRVIYDIGAYEGVWTHSCKKVFPSSTYYQFEANSDKVSSLHDNPTICVLSDKDEDEVTYYKSFHEIPTGNSILKENSLFYDDGKFTTEKRITTTLDTVVINKKYPYPDFLKLDTQGSEILILSGAPKCLEHAQIVLMEVSLHQYNEKAPLIYDFLKFMDEKGFVTFDIVALNYLDYGKHSGILTQVDLLFCRKDSRFLVSRFD